MTERDWRTSKGPYSLPSGGKLEVPKTPVKRIMLEARLKRLKRDFEQRQAARQA